jgi:hypothetical protein
MLEALRSLHVEDLGVRIVSKFGWIIGQVPQPLTHCPGCRAATPRLLGSAGLTAPYQPRQCGFRDVAGDELAMVRRWVRAAPVVLCLR